ncbi:serine/threonine protein kinase, partial [Streptomyces rubrogriseus]|nr:serine/threonine protein kinase [Streptomyces rubrogriseus]
HPAGLCDGLGDADAQDPGRGRSPRTNAAGGARSSGWPVVPPPDLPARPVPRAPLTDVVPRRTLIIIAVVVALAVLGTVLALTLGGGDDDKGAEGGNGGKAVASAGASGDTKQDEQSGTGTDGSASDPAANGDQTGAPDTAASASGETGGGSDDAGKSDDDEDVATTHQGGQGYRIGLPEGWKFASTGSSGDRFTGPRGQKLLVAWTSTPKGDPVADWKSQEQYMVRSNYQKVRIEKVGYRDWNAADWEFTYTDGGTKYRTVDRGFVVNDHQGYALMYTAKAADWGDDLRRDTWRTLSKTFEPKS